MQNLAGKCRAAIDKYDMINNADKIAIGVSGGKDSLALVYLLSKMRAYYPSAFSLKAITVDIRPFDEDTDFFFVTKFCNDLGVPHIIKRTSLSQIIFKERIEKNPCSLCSRMRHGILHNMTIENGCNKIALAHHLDDAVETFFMNVLNNGRLKCFSPVSYLSRKKIKMIRPLVFCTEDEISHMATLNSFPCVKSGCLVDGITQRQRTKETIKLLDKEYHKIREKVLTAIIKHDLDGWGMSLCE